MFKWFRKKQRSMGVEEQLAGLDAAGIQLKPEYRNRVDILLNGFTEEEYEKSPYLLLLTVLGGERYFKEQQEFKYISDDIWHFDPECIEDHGDYVGSLQRLKELSKGLLELEDIRDYVSLEDEEVWVSFKWRGQEHKWHLKADNDWFDMGLLTKLSGLLHQAGSDRRIYTLDLGQTVLVGMFRAEQVKGLEQLITLKFKQV